MTLTYYLMRFVMAHSSASSTTTTTTTTTTTNKKNEQQLQQLELFTWGPAWGLASFDPACLAIQVNSSMPCQATDRQTDRKDCIMLI